MFKTRPSIVVAQSLLCHRGCYSTSVACLRRSPFRRGVFVPAHLLPFVGDRPTTFVAGLHRRSVDKLRRKPSSLSFSTDCSTIFVDCLHRCSPLQICRLTSSLPFFADRSTTFVDYLRRCPSPLVCRLLSSTAFAAALLALNFPGIFSVTSTPATSNV